MANSATNLDLISSSQAQKEVSANALFDAESPAALYGRRASTTANLTWGYYGGALSVNGVVTAIPNGTKTLTNAATNYLECDPTTGNVAVNTSNFTAANIPLYSVVCAGNVVTSYTDMRTGPGFFADKGGSASKTFMVAPATQGNQAAPVSQPVASQMSGEFTVTGNALKFTVNPCIADFRSATLTTGTPNTRIFAASANVVVPFGATLGTTANTPVRLIGGLLDNAGTLEPFIINLNGGVSIDESGVITTTAVSNTANSANVFYSTAARANVPYRLVAACDITEATPGTWATAPSLVLPSSVLSALSGFGYGQSGADYLASRSYNTTYYNVTGKLMFLCVTGVSSALSALDIDVTQNGVTVKYRSTTASAGWNMAAWAVVPPGASYVASITAGTITPQIWVEYK